MSVFNPSFCTDAKAEGFRLEGFDGQTPVLLSMDPLLDIGGEEGHSKSTQKKAGRGAVRLTGVEGVWFLWTWIEANDADGGKYM